MTSTEDPFVGHPSAMMIRDRILKTAGISITPFVAQIGLSYLAQKWPDGFQFTARDVERLIALFRGNTQFGLTTGLDQRPNATCFRERNKPDSLHIRLHRYGGGSEMHIDKVSIVEGIDNVGHVVYADDLAVGIQHFRCDVLHRK